MAMIRNTWSKHWTLNKLLLGAGASAAPTEIDAPAIIFTETEVHNGNVPNTWTDLDLSGTIGAHPALVFLKFHSLTASFNQVGVRKNGDTDDCWWTLVEPERLGVNISDSHSSYWTHLLVVADSSGKIEMRAEYAINMTIDIMGYITGV